VQIISKRLKSFFKIDEYFQNCSTTANSHSRDKTTPSGAKLPIQTSAASGMGVCVILIVPSHALKR
jgi:hypothetical protein